MPIDLQRALQAIGEPTRFRIVELLATRPHAVGEVATALGALQPQTTKHLQALEAAEVIQVHRLGRRRVAGLNHQTLLELSTYLGELARAGGDDTDLADYEAAIQQEQRRLAVGDTSRTLRFDRDLPAAPTLVWQAWTDASLAARWWAPRHFTVSAFTLEREVGAPVRVVLREGGGAEHESRGEVERVEPDRLVFTLAPVGPDSRPLFDARHTLTLSGTERTLLRLDIELTSARDEAASAVAGLQPGWEQLLDSLADLIGEIGPDQPSGNVSTSS